MFIFEKVNFRQKLLFLLFKLGDLFFQLGGVHAFRSDLVNVLMGSFELSLKILVDIMGLVDGLVSEELVGDLKRHKELCGIGASSKFIESAEDPVHDVLNSLFLTVDDFPLEVGVEVSWVAQDFKISTDSVLSLILSFSLDIHLVGIIELTKNFV